MLNEKKMEKDSSMGTTGPSSGNENVRKQLRGLEEEDLLDAEDLDKTFPVAALWTVSTYCLLLLCTYYSAEETEWEYLQGGEKQAATLAFVVFLITILVQVMHISVGNEASDFSGILVAAMVVMMVAMVTNGIMAFGPTVVTFDKITNARVFLTRWCEWIPLAGLMTYLSEAVDVPKRKGGFNTAIFTSLMQSLSCFCAFFFPSNSLMGQR